MPERSGPRHDPTRTIGMVSAAVVAIAAIGFVTGTQASRYVATEPPGARERVEGVPGAFDARTHAELAIRPWELTPAPAGSPPSAAPPGPREHVGSVAYSGAPPTIPHPVRSGAAAECLSCHQDGWRLGDAWANPIPHRELSSCTQCHVSANPPLGGIPDEGPAAVPSTFEGWRRTARGSRAYAAAPPTVPHPTFMRDRCVSCHGPLGRAPLQTPHPERQSCVQCHVAPQSGPPQGKSE